MRWRIPLSDQAFLEELDQVQRIRGRDTRAFEKVRGARLIDVANVILFVLNDKTLPGIIRAIPGPVSRNNSSFAGLSILRIYLFSVARDWIRVFCPARDRQSRQLTPMLNVLPFVRACF